MTRSFPSALTLTHALDVSRGVCVDYEGRVVVLVTTTGHRLSIFTADKLAREKH